MTEKLYYDKPYLKEWEAQVLDIVERDGKVLVLLDRTAFYPEGGGQPADTGYIDDIEVSHVFEEGNDIYHVVNRRPEKPNVKCSLDFERRFYLMQQHTGQHLLSAVFYDRYKGETSSFHLGEDYVSIDISMADMPDKIVKAVEKEVNELIYSNKEIKTYIVDKEELANLPLRKFPKVDEDIRIVEIDKIDYSPCCGTHLTSTGQLGLIKIIKIEKYKGIIRVYFKCGQRAFEDYQLKQDIIVSISRLLAVDFESLQDRISFNNDELRSGQKEIKELKEKLHQYEAKDILSNVHSKLISRSFEGRSFEEVQSLGRVLLGFGEYIVVLSSLKDKKLWFAHNGGYDIHCGKVFKEYLSKYNGRGGGGDKQAQASFTDESSLKEFEEFINSQYKNL
ncbi:alanine--tRNA ligase-related protein [Clostridium swellfunianum]|uniref:alanyl-tRNA editing protein n=1 Tax=Clostridium swellfunianum TaxID=1367462 RepID=UPI00202E8295|nr:alanine--tRNA ligase-related protein [Clostridium swellfunianum]MCM0649753.1 alanine--tRNA ligase-related protein [Clostridium swellfunianum]